MTNPSKSLDFLKTISALNNYANKLDIFKKLIFKSQIFVNLIHKVLKPLNS